MKRRNFLSGLAAAVASLALPAPSIAALPAKTGLGAPEGSLYLEPTTATVWVRLTDRWQVMQGKLDRAGAVYYMHRDDKRG